RYGFNKWADIYTRRQLFSLASFLRATRATSQQQIVPAYGDSEVWREALTVYLMATFDKLVTNSTTICSWNCNTTSVGHTFGRFALPMVWDFTEINALSALAGGYANCLDWVAESVSFAIEAAGRGAHADCRLLSATDLKAEAMDVVITDPPYYD